MAARLKDILARHKCRPRMASQWSFGNHFNRFSAYFQKSYKETHINGNVFMCGIYFRVTFIKLTIYVWFDWWQIKSEYIDRTIKVKFKSNEQKNS